MTQLEDQLRAVLLDTPTPQPRIGNPLAELDRRVGRARARWGTAGVAVLAVVVAAIVVPLSVLGKNAKAARYDAPAPVSWSDHRVQSMTVSADGSVWTLSTNRRNNPTNYLERHDPGSGNVTAKFAVPDWAENVYAAAGYLWMWGGGDGGYPHGLIEALDPTTGKHVRRDFGFGQAIAPGLQAGHPVAATRDGLVALVGRPQAIVTLSVAGSQIAANTIAIHTDALQIFTDGDFAYPSSATRGQDAVNVAGPSGGVQQPVRISGVPLALGDQGIWVASGQHVVQAAGQRGQVGSAIYPRSAWGAAKDPTMAAADGSGGLYVGWAKHAGAATASILTYYSTQALRSEDPVPTALQRVSGGTGLSADAAGGVVYLQANSLSLNTVLRWNPTGVTAPKPAPKPTRIDAQTWRPSGVVRVAAGPNQVWDLAPSAPSAQRVEQRDPATGAVTATYGDPRTHSQLAFGLQRLWLWNLGVGQRQMTVLDTRPNGAGQSLDLPGRLVDSSLTFAGGYAWAHSTAGMLKFAVGSDQTISVLHSSQRGFDDAEQITAEQLAISRGSSPTSTSGHLLEHALAVVKGGYLMVDRDRLVIDDDTGHHGQPLVLPAGLRSEAVLATAGALVDSNGGLYVWIDAPRIGAPDLLYYSPTSVQDVQPNPTAVLRGGGILNAAADPAGGVVAATTVGALLHWNPAAAD